MKRKLFQFLDKKFFIFVALVFLATFGAGLAFSSEEIRISNSSGFKEFIAEKVGEENFDQNSGSDGQKTENTFPEILGQETVKETITEETFVQEKDSLSMDSVNLVQEAGTAVTQLTKGLEENDFSLLYDLFGEDLKGTFGEEEFSQITSISPSIKEVRVLSGPEISGEWLEAIIELTLSDGTKEQYITVFHLESGDWKLFGTEEL